MPTLSTSPRALGWLALGCLPLACTGAGGTPTPEPPDNLPPPLVTIATTTPEVTVLRSSPLAATPLSGTVQPGSEAWLVNLDDPNVAAVRVPADASGAFTVAVEGASSGDRIRVVARTSTRHSAPVDLVINGQANEPGSFAAVAPPLDCLSISPGTELTEVVETGERYAGTFTLRNRCRDEVRIERAVLRFGNQGMALESPPEAIAPGGEAQVSVTIDGHADARERADILLLDVAADRPARYALGVYSVAASSIGKP